MQCTTWNLHTNHRAELFVFSLAVTVGCLRLAPVVDAIACPSSVCTCRWKGGKETAECAGKRLAQLPTGLSRGTQVLDVSRNSFEELPKEMFFRAALTNLQKVKLAECKIRKIDDAALSHLANLVELDLESNLLIAVPSETFIDCPGLRRLNLNRNHIRRVESNAFARLPSLTSLELSDCFLEYVGPRAFVGLDHLRHLKLNGNRLSVLPPDVGFPLGSLHSLDLFDNPWHCDCRLRVLRNWLIVDKLPVNAPLVCAEPARLRHWPLVGVQADDYACEPQQTSSSLTYSVETTEAYSGESSVAVLECHVQADPPPRIRWSRNDRIISNRTAIDGDVPAASGVAAAASHLNGKHRYAVTESGTVQKIGYLSISDVSVDDAGQYLCLAENVAGQVTLNVTLDVMERQAEVSTLSDAHVALISLGLVLISLTTIVFLFVFLARMRHQQLHEDETCKHLPLEKKQLVNHVKFSVHKEKLEMMTTTMMTTSTAAAAATTIENKPLCSVVNSNYNSNTPLQDKIRLDHGDNIGRGGCHEQRMNSRPDIVNIACNAQSWRLTQTNADYTPRGATSSASTVFRSTMLTTPSIRHPSLSNCATAYEGTGALPPPPTTTTTSSSKLHHPPSTTVPLVPVRNRCESQDMLMCAANGCPTPFYEDNSSLIAVNEICEQICPPPPPPPVLSNDQSSLGRRTLNGSTVDTYVNVTADDNCGDDGGGGQFSSMNDQQNEMNICRAFLKDSDGAAGLLGACSRATTIRTCDDTTIGHLLNRDSSIPSSTINNSKTHALNKAVSSRRCGTNALSASAGGVSTPTTSSAPGILKHANLHVGRSNYVPVLPPLPAHHFAQARDSPDEGYEDEVEVEEEVDT